MTFTKIKKRSGGVAAFDRVFIERAIGKTCDAIGRDDKDFIPDLVSDVLDVLDKKFDDGSHVVSVEDVQDAVEKQLMRQDYFDVAKAYILYREDQREKRLEQEAGDSSTMVTLRDGTQQPFDQERIRRSIERACEGLENATEMTNQIMEETRLTTYNGITETELDEATINSALQNVKDDILYDTVATRILARTSYKRVLGDYTGNDDDAVQKLHEEKFPEHIKKGVKEGFLSEKMEELFDLEKLAAGIDSSRDELFVYSGLSTLLHRYSLKREGDIPFETPQFMFMRVCMGLSYVADDPTEEALSLYERMSKHKYIAGGSTNVGSGTRKSSLSNCFLIQMEDDIEHISKTVSDVMLISKATGGLGVSVTKLRANGSPLSKGGLSTGPTTFAKIMDTAIRAIQRGGKKVGALAFYMENWHLDFPEFIDWRHNAGDDYLRMRTANTASYLSDEFMRRVIADDQWYMFDPKETPELIELYGKEFSKKYAEYIKKAEAGEMRAFKKDSARTIWKKILVSLQGTSHPWVTFKGSMNIRALNNNTGTIHQSNLCTEIALPQDRENIAVCNLASVNISAHLTDGDGGIDWVELAKTVRISIRHLDNLVDINELPVAEARKSDSENRAVGLGVMGLADIFERLGMSYDSEEAYDLTDMLFEFVSYHAIDESANIAAVKGSYKNFKGSEWSKGHVPIDSLEKLRKERGEYLTIDNEHRFNVKGHELDWDGLRKKVKKGMRNATLLAVAPNANIGLLVGTVPGMDVRFAQIFSRNKFSGKYLDINHNLVKELKSKDLWMRTKESILENQGDISTIEDIPQEMRDRYKTSFGTSPYAMIEVAARAQKWIDQAISRNMYLETRDIGEIMEIYQTAWKKGLKSTYYLHMKPRHTAEQSAQKVNKATALGKRGFGGLKSKAQKAKDDVLTVEPAQTKKGFGATTAKKVEKAKPKITVAANTCPTDPALLAQCDSCQ